MSTDSHYVQDPVLLAYKGGCALFGTPMLTGWWYLASGPPNRMGDIGKLMLGATWG